LQAGEGSIASRSSTTAVGTGLASKNPFIQPGITEYHGMAHGLASQDNFVNSGYLQANSH